MPLNFPHRSAVGLLAVQAVPVLMLYALALYFQAATASLSNTYQPGIELLRAVISPSGLLLLVFLVACLRKSYAAARVATVTGAGAILVCALMLASIASHGDGSGGPLSTILFQSLYRFCCRQRLPRFIGSWRVSLFFASAAHQSGSADRPPRAID